MQAAMKASPLLLLLALIGSRGAAASERCGAAQAQGSAQAECSIAPMCGSHKQHIALLPFLCAVTFVTRSGNQLYADGRPFYHVGFNGVWMPSSVAFGLTARVDQTLDAAQVNG